MTTPARGTPAGRGTAYESSDTAYRTLLGHSTACPTCRAGVSCLTAAKLGRAWREARR